MPETERFFSRANVHRFFWSVLLAIAGFAAGHIWTSYRGKEKVIVATAEDGAKPIVVRVERTPDDPAAQTVDRINVLVDEVRHLRREAGTSSHGYSAPSTPERARGSGSFDSAG